MKALFFDIDGTLVDWRSGVFEVPRDALREMRRIRDAGNRLFVSSGRPRPFIGPELRDLGCFDGYVLLNGGLIEYEGAIIYKELLDATVTRVVCDLHEELGCEYSIDTATNACINGSFAAMLDLLETFRLSITTEFDHNEAIRSAIKIESFPTDEQRAFLIGRIERDLSGQVCFDDNGTGNTFEVYSPRLSKATGIARVLEHLDISIEDTYAFGDGINDLEMIRACGCGVAMGNAVPEVKAVADLVCGTVAEGGLAQALRELFP